MRPENDIERFVDAQRGVFEAALGELRAGRKAGHWMWFVFPQLRGLGRSGTSRYYGLGSAAEAAEYLAHPVLGPRLRICIEAILAHDKPASEIFGSPDDTKLRSSLTLFSAVAPHEPAFSRALQKFFDGKPDPLTVAALKHSTGA